MSASRQVRLYEVGPRDGLQNEARAIPTADKIKLIDLLSLCGFEKIEATSFVSPRAVPQLADAAAVMAGICRAPGVTYAALTPNLKGYQAARAAGAGEVAIFASASEGFSQANIRCSITESLLRFAPIAEAAHADGIPLRGYVSCVTDCPYDGVTPPANVAALAAQLLALGCYEISLGDTLGAATPATTQPMLDAVLRVVPATRLAGHFHDTYQHALANIDLCLDHGLRVFDASVGGLGGCPYAPGATGNVATERVVAHLATLGYDTGIDLIKLAAAADFARGLSIEER